MIDTLNTERYTIVARKTLQIKSAGVGASTNTGTTTAVSTLLPVPADNAGIYYGTNNNYVSRATKIVKMWIPGSKFSKTGKIKYENGTDQPKFFDYHALVYAYSNYSTNQDQWNVGRLNDYVKTLYFKDA